MGVGWILLRPLLLKPAEGDDLVRRLGSEFNQHISAYLSTRESEQLTLYSRSLATFIDNNSVVYVRVRR